MEIVADVRVIGYGVLPGVVFPVQVEELKERYNLADYDEDEFVIGFDEHNLIAEGDSFSIVNEFAELVSDVDDDLVLAVAQVTGYKAGDFIRFDFSFEDCRLFADVTNRRELGEYWYNELGVEGVGKENLERYFDHEAYGRDIDLENAGGFTDYGYVDIV